MLLLEKVYDLLPLLAWLTEINWGIKKQSSLHVASLRILKLFHFQHNPIIKLSSAEFNTMKKILVHHTYLLHWLSS